MWTQKRRCEHRLSDGLSDDQGYFILSLTISFVVLGKQGEKNMCAGK